MLRLVLVASALALGLVAPVARLDAQEAPAAAPAQTLPAITVIAAAERVLRDRVIASGLVAPVETVQVAPLIEGQPIESLEADVGDRVEAGQVLARLSKMTLDLQRSQFAASIAAARATIAQAEAQLLEARTAADEAQRVNERTQALQKQGTVSRAAADQASANAISATARVTVATQSLEAARAQLALAEAQLANVELQLARTEVRAPVAGEITARNAVLGGIASAAGQPMFQLIRDGALELRAEIAEGDVVRLAPGLAAKLRGVGTSGPLAGTIRLVEPTIDTQTRLGRARISISDATEVRAGMFMEAEILVVERAALAVPVTAVGAAADGATVMKVVDGAVARVPVRTGIRDGGWIEIIEGLSAGDTVVARAGSFVRDGDRINPVPLAAETN
jgi:HlyD family secretion protein